MENHHHEFKICRRCPPEIGPQPLTAFHVATKTKDGRQHHCRVCQRAMVDARRATPEGYELRRRYREEHNDEIRARAKRWRQAHPERNAEQTREYRKRCSPEVIARTKLRQKLYAKEYRTREVTRAYDHNYRETHREQFRAYARKYYAANRTVNVEARRAKQREQYHARKARAQDAEQST